MGNVILLVQNYKIFHSDLDSAASASQVGFMVIAYVGTIFQARGPPEAGVQYNLSEISIAKRSAQVRSHYTEVYVFIFIVETGVSSNSFPKLYITDF